jgi:hypothetical protein
MDRVYELSQELAEHRIPAAPRYVVDDISAESLASIMAEQDGKIALLSAEPNVFDIMAGKYTRGNPNLEVYLKGHAGDTLRVDRVGRSTEFVEAPALTLGLAMQPDVLGGLIQKPSFRGRGLLGRFLYALPRPNIGRRKVNSKPLDPSIRNAYFARIRHLLEIPAREEQ